MRKGEKMKIGIDLGGSHIAVGIVSPKEKILKKIDKQISFVDMNKENIKIQIRDTIVSLINNIIKELQIPVFVIEKIGIGVPGIVEKNIIKKCEKFEIKEYDLAKDIEEYYGIPVKLVNDSEAALLAEKKYGALKDSKNAVFLCIGTGIGGGIIYEENVTSSECGHIIINSSGDKCHCGNKGCFETYCSMRVFKNQIIQIFNLDKNVAQEDILNILKNEINQNNKVINEYINEYLENFCIGIANIVNTIHTDTICLGGGFTYFKDILYDKLVKKVQEYNFQFDVPKIVLSNLQNDAGIIGSII